ncbi:MAG TPA: hypothetical protein VGD67_26515 [Pseudonocardiaceae bacterium]
MIHGVRTWGLRWLAAMALVGAAIFLGHGSAVAGPAAGPAAQASQTEAVQPLACYVVNHRGDSVRVRSSTNTGAGTIGWIHPGQRATLWTGCSTVAGSSYTCYGVTSNRWWPVIAPDTGRYGYAAAGCM